MNDAPVAVNDTDSVNEDETVTKTGSQDDVMNDDTDADDDDSFTVTQIKKMVDQTQLLTLVVLITAMEHQ